MTDDRVAATAPGDDLEPAPAETGQPVRDGAAVSDTLWRWLILALIAVLLATTWVQGERLDVQGETIDLLSDRIEDFEAEG